MPRKKSKSLIPADPQKLSAAQYLTYMAATGGEGDRSSEILYQDENIWLTQKMMTLIYGIEVNSVNYHIKKLFKDAELEENAVIR